MSLGEHEETMHSETGPGSSPCGEACSDDVTCHFDKLSDELILSIFSFAAKAPLEKLPSTCCTPPPSSSLTQIYPEVSKLWGNLSQHDSLWRPAIMRQLEEEPALWKEGLLKIVAAKHNSGLETITPNDNRTISAAYFLDKVHAALGRPAFKTLYHHVVSNHIRFTGPVFYMRGHVLLGDSYRLHLFEHRYRVLVAEIMKGYPEEARKGAPIVTNGKLPPPLFIHANRDPGSSTAGGPAALVQILRCNICDRDGTADVLLLPIAYVWLEKLWVRPRTGNLHYAQCLRMGGKANRGMHELANQEALESLMNCPLTDHLDYTDDEYENDDLW